MGAYGCWSFVPRRGRAALTDGEIRPAIPSRSGTPRTIDAQLMDHHPETISRFPRVRRKPLGASLWRQKVDVVQGREPKDFGHVGQSVQRPEQILELSGGGDPEERPGRLVG